MRQECDIIIRKELAHTGLGKYSVFEKPTNILLFQIYKPEEDINTSRRPSSLRKSTVPVLSIYSNLVGKIEVKKLDIKDYWSMLTWDTKDHLGVNRISTG